MKFLKNNFDTSSKEIPKTHFQKTATEMFGWRIYEEIEIEKIEKLIEQFLKGTEGIFNRFVEIFLKESTEGTLNGNYKEIPKGIIGWFSKEVAEGIPGVSQ